MKLELFLKYLAGPLLSACSASIVAFATFKSAELLEKGMIGAAKEIGSSMEKGMKDVGSSMEKGMKDVGSSVERGLVSHMAADGSGQHLFATGLKELGGAIKDKERKPLFSIFSI